jgi:hypothetical protein
MNTNEYKPHGAIQEIGGKKIYSQARPTYIYVGMVQKKITSIVNMVTGDGVKSRYLPYGNNTISQ